MRSTSRQGGAEIVVEFGLGANLDVMAQDLRDTIAVARLELPPDLEPPVVQSFNPNDIPVLWFPLESHAPVSEITDFAERHLSEAESVLGELYRYITEARAELHKALPPAEPPPISE